MATSLLVAYTLALAFLVPRLLRGARWTRRSPRLGMGVWLAACFSAVAATCLVGAVLVVPLLTVGHALIALVQACGFSLSHVYRVAPSLITDVVGVGVLGMIVIRVAYAVARVAVPQWWLRRRHAAALRVLARHDPTHDILVVEHPVPAAYCLPARGGSIVVSEGAVRRLDPQLLEAVVAHERAHLRGRHYLITTSAAVLARAFARLPLFTAAEQELRCLVEMAADDAAARRTTPRTVARALLDLVADPSPPAPALGMSGPAAAERVRRLIAPRRPLNAATRCLCVATAVSSLVLPLAAPTVPALFDDAAHCVPAAAATAALSSL